MGVLCWSLFWYALLYVLSCFAIILTRKRELVALLLMSFVNAHSAVGLQFVIVVFPDHTHFLFGSFWSGKPLRQSSQYFLFYF